MQRERKGDEARKSDREKKEYSQKIRKSELCTPKTA